MPKPYSQVWIRQGRGRQLHDRLDDVAAKFIDARAHRLVAADEPAATPDPTPATVACIAQACRLAISGSNEVHIVGPNVALEAASFDFFSRVSPHLDSLGLGHEYWRVHVALDEFDSADGLAYLTPAPRTRQRDAPEPTVPRAVAHRAAST